MDNKDTLLSSKQAADLLNISDSRVRQLALAANLQRKGRDWLFNQSEIEILRTSLSTEAVRIKKSSPKNKIEKKKKGLDN